MFGWDFFAYLFNLLCHPSTLLFVLVAALCIFHSRRGINFSQVLSQSSHKLVRSWFSFITSCSSRPWNAERTGRTGRMNVVILSNGMKSSTASRSSHNASPVLLSRVFSIFLVSVVSKYKVDSTFHFNNLRLVHLDVNLIL